MSEELKRLEREFEAEAARINAGRKPKFGDLMRNPWAGESNPRRDAYFVRKVGDHYEFTDKQGDFWQTRAKFAFFIDATPPSPIPGQHIAWIALGSHRTDTVELIDGTRLRLAESGEIIGAVQPSPSTAQTVQVPVETYLWLMGMGNDAFTADRQGAFWWRSAFNERTGLDMMAIYQASKSPSTAASPVQLPPGARVNCNLVLSEEAPSTASEVGELPARIQAALDLLADAKLPSSTWRDVSNVLHACRDSLARRTQAEGEKDAERYRWLRERFDACAAVLGVLPKDDGELGSWVDVSQGIGQGTELDAAIDAAIAATQSTEPVKDGS